MRFPLPFPGEFSLNLVRSDQVPGGLWAVNARLTPVAYVMELPKQRLLLGVKSLAKLHPEPV